MRDIFITSSILILAILLIRTLLKGRINPRIQYALWLLVVVRLVLPVPLWNSRVSVMNFFPNILFDESSGYSYSVIAGMAGNDGEEGLYNSGKVDAAAGEYNLEDTEGGTASYSAADSLGKEGIYISSGVDNIIGIYGQSDAADGTNAYNPADQTGKAGISLDSAGKAGIYSQTDTANETGTYNSSGAANRADDYNLTGIAGEAGLYNPSDAANAADAHNVKGAANDGSVNNPSYETRAANIADGMRIYNPSIAVYIISALNLIKNLLPYIWIAGILITGGYMLFYQRKWKSYLYANRKPLAGKEIYKETLSVYTVSGLPSPCLSGRSIYMTGEMAEDEDELEHILAHEYCHYRQLDSLWVIVRCVLTAVYWFNPLVWAAAYVSKQDSELACDEAVIRLLGEDERIAYGKTLVKLVSGDGSERCRIGIASTMNGGEKGIKERISMIAGKPKYIAAAAAVVVLAAAVLIAVTFSGAGKNDGMTAASEESKTEDGADASAKLQAGEASGGNLLGSSEGEEEQLQTINEQLEAEAGTLKNNEEEFQATEEQLTAEVELLKKKAAETTESAQLAALEAEIKAREAALAEIKARKAALMEKISVYDEAIISANYQDGISDIKNYRDYMQGYINRDYVNQEKSVLDEGIYQLMKLKGSDNTDIVIYGMYTKEYGCKGVKILIGEDINTYAMEWIPTYMLGMENISVYEKAKDGMPRVFAWKMPLANTGDSEIWDLYICDRYDTGTVAPSQFKRKDYSKQISERLTFGIAQSEGKAYVYDNGEKVGEIDMSLALAGAPGSDSSDSSAAVKKIKEVVWDENDIGWELGHNEDELKLITTVGFKFEGTDEVWYRNLNFISFPVECGSFGEREFSLGKAQIETDYVNYWKHTAPDQDETGRADDSQIVDDGALKLLRDGEADAHYDVEIAYANPCPSYTRISDSFGVRTHPVTGEKRMHSGIDLAAEKGDDIAAAADGSVISTGYDAENGSYVILYHVLNGEFTYYTHCDEILVKEGDKVTREQKIATVGSSGRSTGPHLHFAISRNGEYIEPVFK